MTDAVHITVTNCGSCPSMFADRHYTGDSFEMVFDWKCERSHGAIIATIEWNDPKPAIPAWCPLRSNIEGKGLATTDKETRRVSMSTDEQNNANEGQSRLTGGLAADEAPRYNSVVAGQLLCIRDALIMGDHAEAYHLLYLIADPNLSSTEPWAEMERIALAANG